MFEAWLKAQGWSVQRQVEWIDLLATRGAEELRVEVKGDTGDSAGLDADTMYGQLLRRMEDRPGVSYAVVGPTRSVKAMLRVPAFVRERLRIQVFEVTAAGEVETRA